MAGERDVREWQGLWLSAVAGLVIGIIGIVFAVVSDSEAIMLDGVFNLTYFATALFTVRVASLIHRGETTEFPMGYAFFEPLVNGVKGLLILGVAGLAFFGAIEALLEGGRQIKPGLAAIYGVIGTVLCWTTALVLRRLSKRCRSPLVEVDAKSWTLNALITSAVLLAFLLILAIEGTALAPAAPYVDPGLVLLVVIVSVGAPIRFAWQSLMELLNRAPSSELVESIRERLESSLQGLPVRWISLRVVQPGRTRLVLAHVVLPAEFSPGSLEELDRVREQAWEELRLECPETVLDIVFTADPHWGALADEKIET